MSALLRIPPHDERAEQSVLGSILLDPSCLPTVAGVLSPEDFYVEAHRQIYAAMLALFQSRKHVDLITLSDTLETAGTLEGVGGSAKIAELTEYVPSARRVADHAAIVRKKADQRAVIRAGFELQEIGYSDDADSPIADAQRTTLALADRTLGDDDFDMARLADDFYNAYAERHEKGVVDRGIETGARDVDERVRGFRPGQFVIIAGRASAGKTAYSLALAYHAAQTKHRVLFLSLEMLPLEMYTRLLARLSQVDGITVAHGLPSTVQHEQIVNGIDYSRSLPITVTKAFGYSMEDIRTRALRHKAAKGLDILFVDYIGLIRASVRTQSRVQEVSDISRKLKNLALELRIPVVALAQLNRNVDARNDKKPFLSDLRESGSLEQDADIVLLLNRPGYYDENADQSEFHVNVAKHRSGETGNAILSFDARTMQFTDRDPMPHYRSAA